MFLQTPPDLLALRPLRVPPTRLDRPRPLARLALALLALLLLIGVLGALAPRPAAAQLSPVPRQYQGVQQFRNFTGASGADTLYFSGQPAGSFGYQVPTEATHFWLTGIGLYVAAASSASSDVSITQGAIKRPGSLMFNSYSPYYYAINPPVRFDESSGSTLIFTFTGAGGAHVLWYTGYWTK